jgi:ABC-type branched-subunit amino acid transport system substrate-binding protein
LKPQATLAALMAVALFAAGCGRSGTSTEETPAGAAKPVTGDFGDLKGICGPGKATTSPAQGVTADAIKLGVFTDVSFTKKSEFIDAAKVFTTWCNASGGIKGRKLTATTRDSKLFEVRQRMLEACREDFALVGGGAALDATGVKERLSCLLPDFPAQVVQKQNNGSDLQVNQTGGTSYDRYPGYYDWLMKEAYPASKGSVGIINGDSPITKDVGAQAKESLTVAGAKFIYDDKYPVAGVSDWTPYAQAMKSKGVKGLVFYGDFLSLVKLEQVLTNIGHKLDWIDANNNSYSPAFIKLGGKALSFQNNLADLGGFHLLENASTNPATQQILDLFKQYAPQAPVTLPAVRAFATWLLFAKAAGSCGEALTRKCVYEAARKEAAWTGGGLMAPVDLTKADLPLKCFNIVQATPEGWKPADFKPNKGMYRCDGRTYKFTGDYGKPMTLADVGKSMSDVK